MAVGTVTRTVRIVVDGSGARDGANVVKRSLKEADGAAADAARSADAYRSALGALKAAMAAVGATALLREIVNVGLAYDRMVNTLKAATGSTAGAAREMAFLRAESNRLGLDLKSAAEAYGGLAAAARGTSLEGQKTRDIFSAVAGAMTALGRTSDQTEGALLAVQQMLSKGTVQAEELRGQLGERLPGAFQTAARAMGVTTAELDAMLKKGQVVASDFLPRFAAALKTEWGDAATEAANSLQANFIRIGTAVTELGIVVSQSDFGKALTEQAQRLLAALTGPDVKSAAQTFGDLLGAGMRLAGDAAAFLARNIDLVTYAALAFAAVKGAELMVALAGAVLNAAASFKALTLAMASNPLTAAAIAITAIGVAIYELTSGSREAATAQRSFADALGYTNTATAQAAANSATLADRMKDETRAKEAATIATLNLGLSEAYAARQRASGVLGRLADAQASGLAAPGQVSGGIEAAIVTVTRLDQIIKDASVKIGEAQGRLAGLDRTASSAAATFEKVAVKTAEKTKKLKEAKTSYESLNESIKESTVVALEHERRLRAGSKEFEAITKADDALADSLTQKFMPAAQKASAEIMTFDRLLGQNKITAETHAAAVADVNRELRESDPAFKAAQKAATEFAQDGMQEPFKEAARSIQSTLADTFKSVFSGGVKTFKDFGKSVLNIFVELAAQIAALMVFPPVPGAVLGTVAGLDPEDFHDGMKEAA